MTISAKTILEGRDLTLYKQLLRTLGEYTDSFPATGVDRIFNSMVRRGLKSVPKDKKALDILDSLIYGCPGGDPSMPRIVSDLLNKRFSDLPFPVRPVFMNGRKREVAFFSKGGRLHDRVISLLLVGDEPVEGWVDVNGKKVEIVDMSYTDSPAA